MSVAAGYRGVIVSLFSLVQLAGAAVNHDFAVSVHHDINLSPAIANRILTRAEKLICLACAKRRKGACQIKLRLDGDQVTRIPRGTSPLIGNGRMTRDAVNAFLAPVWSGTQVRNLYIVKNLGGCGEKPAYDTLGCSSKPGNLILVRLTRDLPTQSDRQEDWITEQALVWAHELGHNLGLGDLENKGNDDRIMYNRCCTMKQTKLDARECNHFNAKPRFTVPGLPVGEDLTDMSHYSFERRLAVWVKPRGQLYYRSLRATFEANQVLERGNLRQADESNST